MLSVKGHYKDGVIIPSVPIEGHDAEEVIITFLADGETEADVMADLRIASLSTLRAYWLNDADAVYDTL